MTKITTLNFNSYNELQNQFVTWIKVYPQFLESNVNFTIIIMKIAATSFSI